MTAAVFFALFWLWVIMAAIEGVFLILQAIIVQDGPGAQYYEEAE